MNIEHNGLKMKKILPTLNHYCTVNKNVSKSGHLGYKIKNNLRSCLTLCATPTQYFYATRHFYPKELVLEPSTTVNMRTKLHEI